MPPPVPSVNGAESGAGASISLSVSANEAHVYSECARIWNPIHTDRATALAAGLPDIILHGTAILARAVSEIVSRFVDKDPSRVERVSVGAFGAPVFMPSTITLKLLGVSQTGAWFEVLNGEGMQAIRDGYVGFRPKQSAL